MQRYLLIMLATLVLMSAAQKPTIYIIGDSTAATKATNKRPETGWGEMLHQFVDTNKVSIVNKALNGRSSKSFYDEGNWTPIKKALRSGDVVIIQFGHNDEKTSDATRGTLPGSTYEQYLRIYINEARAQGATPILATSIERNGWKSDTEVKASHATASGDYPQAVRNLAQAQNLTLIDMTALSTALFLRAGQDSTTNRLFMNLAPGVHSNYPNGNSDNTHLQSLGAQLIAQELTQDLCRQQIAPFTQWLRNCATTPEPEPDPEIPAIATHTFSALNFCRADGVSEAKNSGYTSSAYLNLHNELSAAVEYEFCFDHATTAQVELRFANGTTPARPMALYLRDSLVYQYNFSSTTLWTAWQPEASPSLNFTAGCQRLRLVSTTADGGPNLDWIGFTAPVTVGNCEAPVILHPAQPLNNKRTNSPKIPHYFNLLGQTIR